MATVKRKVDEEQDALIIDAQAEPAQLPTVVPVTPQPVALGTLNAATPGALVQGATELATELARIIQRQRLSTKIQGRDHVNVEGWTTLGVMLGCVAREVQTIEQQGGVYVSTVELVRMCDGVCISRASAECGDEKPWNARPKYARRSMAQTRATGKACRLAFSWIMSLAGYEVTPAEEMQDKTDETAVKCISEGMLSLLEAQIRHFGLDRNRVLNWVKRAWNVDSFNALETKQIDRLVTKLEQWHGEEYAKAEAASAMSECPF